MDFTLVFLLLLTLFPFTCFLRIILIIFLFVIQYSNIEFIVYCRANFLFLYIPTFGTLTLTNIWLLTRSSEVTKDALPETFTLLFWNVSERVVFIIIEILHWKVGRPR